jgi:hypothetical protein
MGGFVNRPSLTITALGITAIVVTMNATLLAITFGVG